MSLPSGTYFVGDVSYFLQDALLKDWTTHYSDGYFCRDDGVGFAVVKPLSGNGLYTGSNKFIYDVDEDNFGIVPVELGDEAKFTGCGTFHKFINPVSLTLNGGIITVVSGDWRLDIDSNESVCVDSDDTGYDSWS